MTTNPVDQLAESLGATREVFANITPEQWTLPTPCEEWNVAEVMRHLIGGNFRYAAAIRGDAPPDADDWRDAEFEPLTAYEQSADQVLAAFRRQGALDALVTVPFGTVPGVVALHLRITEVLVHGWDLARATGQAVNFPDSVAEQELRFSQAKLGDIPAGRRPFAPPLPVAPDAPAIDQLAACLGRRVDSLVRRPA
jgi:uncharacterized protein (TIGR03086 family)